MSLVDDLIKEGWLKTPEIIKAFRNIRRKDFIPEDVKNLAELNEALPIDFGQTISQPLTVAFMLELLRPKAGDKILDIGSGSGWTSTLLADIVGGSGKVIAIEVIPELKKFSEKNIRKYGFIEKKIVMCILGDGLEGFKKKAPYDKILVSASAKTNLVTQAWKKQLKIGGRLVCPIQNSIWLFIKQPSRKGYPENEFQNKEYPGFVFVPLVKK